MNDSILDTIERLEGAMSAARENVAGQIELLKRQRGWSQSARQGMGGSRRGPSRTGQASEAYDRWQADGGQSVPLPY